MEVQSIHEIQWWKRAIKLDTFPTEEKQVQSQEYDFTLFHFCIHQKIPTPICPSHETPNPNFRNKNQCTVFSGPSNRRFRQFDRGLYSDCVAGCSASHATLWVVGHRTWGDSHHQGGFEGFGGWGQMFFFEKGGDISVKCTSKNSECLSQISQAFHQPSNLNLSTKIHPEDFFHVCECAMSVHFFGCFFPFRIIMGVFLCSLSNQNIPRYLWIPRGGCLGVESFGDAHPSSGAEHALPWPGSGEGSSVGGVGKVGWSGEVGWLVRDSSCFFFWKIEVEVVIRFWIHPGTEGVFGMNVCRKVALCHLNSLVRIARNEVGGSFSITTCGFIPYKSIARFGELGESSSNEIWSHVPNSSVLMVAFDVIPLWLEQFFLLGQRPITGLW